MGKKRRNRPNFNPASAPQAQIQQRSIQFAGPLPLPAIIKGYEEACPGSADRIIKMAENQASHRMELEKSMLASNMKKESIGQWLAFAIAMTSVIGGVIVILCGKSAEGIGVIIAALVALAGVFIYGRHAQGKERKEKNLQ
jgi:uncharacterized membrane protein